MKLADVIKRAEIDPSMASASVPQVAVIPTPAQGRRGPVGLSPRTNYSRVNTGVQEAPDAGQIDQKSMEPKLANNQLMNEVSMNSIAVRPSIQQMLKSAMDGAAVGAASVAQEARRQLGNLEDGAPKTAAGPSESVSGEEARKLAAAVEFCAEALIKSGADLSGPWAITGSTVEPGKGPGALSVSTASGNGPISDDVGSSHQPKPFKPGMERALVSKTDAANQTMTDYTTPPGGSEGQKVSMAQVIKKAAAGRSTGVASMAKAAAIKMAEDAINPARISAGAAVPPRTNDATQAGPPAERKDMVPSTAEGVAALTRRMAKAPMKAEMRNIVNEPMMSAATDKVLDNAFVHTDQAGAKISSAEKVAEARALVRQLAANAEYGRK